MRKGKAMSSAIHDPGSHGNGKMARDGVAEELRKEREELRQERERLQELAQKLEAREEALADMEANYPYFREIAYKHLRDVFDAELGELPDKDLETIARDANSEPLEAFIDELRELAKRP